MQVLQRADGDVATVSHAIPYRRSIRAVPSVARTVNPSAARRCAGNTIERLSRFATETNTVPDVGSTPSAAS